jgi:hypothetical protein
MAQRGEFTNSHYAFAIQHTYERLQKAGDGLARGNLTVPDTKKSALINLPPRTYKPARWLNLQPTIQGSPLTRQFLGRYYAMYRDFEMERPIPSWEALRWLVEDYGESVIEDFPWDLQYLEESVNWTLEPPPAVLTNGQFCNCPRRYLWKPTATIDSVEYNWPVIPGQFNTFTDCANAYQAFHEAHIHHTDPVCFRAAVFCDFLHFMCVNYQVVIDVNHFNIQRPEIHLLIKLQYQGARWQRVVEVMAITHFLFGPHLALVNEFTSTRYCGVTNWLKFQRTHNLKLLVRDDVVQKKSDKLERRLRDREEKDRNKQPRFD